MQHVLQNNYNVGITTERFIHYSNRFSENLDVDQFDSKTFQCFSLIQKSKHVNDRWHLTYIIIRIILLQVPEQREHYVSEYVKDQNLFKDEYMIWDDKNYLE